MNDEAPKSRPINLDELEKRLHAVEEALVLREQTQLIGLTLEALKAAKRHPAHTCVTVGRITEYMLTDVVRLLSGSPPKTSDLGNLIGEANKALKDVKRSEKFRDGLSQDLTSRLQRIRTLRNLAAHANERRVTADDALEALRHVHELSLWYVQEVLESPVAPEPSQKIDIESLVSRPPPPVPPTRPWWRLPAALSAGVLLLILTLVVMAPTFERLQVVEGEQGDYSLILSGKNVTRFAFLWRTRWVEHLAKHGVIVPPEASWEHRGSGEVALPVHLSTDLSSDVLPLPSLGLGNLPETRGTFTFRLRVAVVRYKRTDIRETDELFSLLAGYISRLELRGAEHVRFDPRPVLTHFATVDFEPSNAAPTFEKMQHVDAVYSSVYVSLLLRAHLSGAQGRPAEAPLINPFDWIACNVGPDGALTYSSVLYTPSSSKLAQVVPKGTQLTPEKFQSFASGLKEERVEVYYGSTSSTSGFFVPCLTWHDAFLDRKVHIVHMSDHAQTFAQVTAPSRSISSEIRLGFGFRELVEAASRTRESEGKEGVSLLWESERIPHGGLYLLPGIPNLKRAALSRAFIQLFEDEKSHNITLSWPKLGDVGKLERCTTSNFEKLEAMLAGSSALGKCQPDAALTPRNTPPKP